MLRWSQSSWFAILLAGDRYQVTFENGLTDEYPRYLLRLE